MTNIRGKIIRIIDRKTIIVNLGSNNGITNKTIFSIIGDAEPIIDPETHEELGKISIVKARVKARQVAEKYTIATTSWENIVYKFMPAIDAVYLRNLSSAFYDTEKVDEGELNIKPEDLQPWKAWSVEPVKIGDLVETEVTELDKTIKSDKTEVKETKKLDTKTEQEK